MQHAWSRLPRTAASARAGLALLVLFTGSTLAAQSARTPAPQTPADLSTLPVLPPGIFEWAPERMPEGPISILLSGTDRTLYVHRNGVLIGRAGVTLAVPDRPRTSGVYVMLEGIDSASTPFVPGQPNRLWQAVALPGEGAAGIPHDAADRVRIPVEFARQVYGLIEPGTTLMVTHRPAAGFTTTPADFTVMATDAGAGR